jgi:hypothetical protein
MPIGGARRPMLHPLRCPAGPRRGLRRLLNRGRGGQEGQRAGGGGRAG